MDQGKTKKTNDVAQLITSVSLVVFSVSVTLAFIFTSYLNKTTFDIFLSFPASDTPPVPSDFFSSPLGVHSFGDFLQPLWQATLQPSPFLNGYSSYPPAANGLFWLFARLSFWKAYLLFHFLAFVFLLVGLRRLMAQYSLANWVQIVIAGFLLSAPYMSGVDRGNSQLLVIGLLILSFSFEIPKHNKMVSILFGFAIAIKMYPVLFLLIFVKRRNWKVPVLAILWALIFNAIPLLFFKGGIYTNAIAFIENVFSSQDELSRLSLSTNNSINGLFLTSINLGVPIPFSISILTFSISAIIFSLIYFTKREIEILLLSAISICLIPNYVAPYTLTMFFVPLCMFYKTNFYERDRWSSVLAILLCLLMAPKHLALNFINGPFRPDQPTYMSLLNPSLMLLMIFVIALRIILDGILQKLSAARSDK